jgi:hypothetical protein
MDHSSAFSALLSNDIRNRSFRVLGAGKGPP